MGAMGIMSYIKDVLSSGLKSVSDSINGEQIVRRMRFEIMRFERRMVRRIMSAFVVLFAILFIAIAAVFSLIEYAGITRTLSFAIIGVVLLLIGLMINLKK